MCTYCDKINNQILVKDLYSVGDSELSEEQRLIYGIGKE